MNHANDNHAPAPAPRTLREFSRCGPCITLGTVTRETRGRIYYQPRSDARERYVTTRRLYGARVHVEPCPSCTDHPRTQYPDGYMD